jgi:glutamine cyclotransferase
MKNIFNCAVVAICLAFTACNSAEKKADIESEKNNKQTQTAQIVPKDYETIREISFDPSAFIQGLIYLNGDLLMSTGLQEHSSLRRLNAESGEEKKSIKIPDLFCEGIAVVKDKIYQLTWQDGLCLVYNLSDFKQIDKFEYDGEGWGLAYDGKYLLMSDGSDAIYSIDPKTFKKKSTIHVKDKNGMPIYNLNELEFAEGKIWANIWMEDNIISINPENGQVEKKINFSALRAKLGDNKYAEALNGIAYNPDKKTFYISGKLWGKAFEVKIN